MEITKTERLKKLENSRVLLRILSTSDVDNLVHIALDEQALWKFTLHKINSRKKLLSYIDSAISETKKGISIAYSVYDKNTGEHAGSTRIYDIDLVNKTCAIGFTWYGKSFQGTGLNVNCKFLLFEMAFETLQMERVQFRVDKENIRSINAIKSLGCKEEGVLRSNMYRPNGERRDSMILSILKEEWYSSVKHNLKRKITT